MYSVETQSALQTEEWGQRLGTHLRKGDTIALEGDLGAGKTAFTKGIAKGLGVQRMVNSPTFTIIKQYEGRLPLVHIDAYRLEAGGEDLGFEELFEASNVCVVEWPSLLGAFLPTERLTVRLQATGDSSRALAFQPLGARYDELCEELFHDLARD